MSRKITLIAAGGLATALMACPTRTPTPPETPRPVRVPPGCERNQAGEYHHEENPAFLYRGEDDGGTLTLAVMRAREGGQAQADGGTVSIVLNRTPDGFVGETRATTFTGAGTACPVRFPTEATTCDERGLTLRTVAATAIDENCRPAPNGKTAWKEQRLLRGVPDAGAPPPPTAGDAGTPDGGR
jgi:hypothetical protein